MDDIYGLLVYRRLSGCCNWRLRRSTDMARGVLERTRGDLTVALQQQALTEALVACGGQRLVCAGDKTSELTGRSMSRW